MTSLADPDSIRVAGTTDDHPARINDLTVDLVSNVYSSLSTDLDSEDESDESDNEEPVQLQAARNDLRRLDVSTADVNERRAASEKELNLLEQANISRPDIVFVPC